MKKFFAAAAAVLAAAVLCSCAFLPKYRDPKRITIDGETYISGFYGDLWPNGITVGEDEPCDLESKYHLWWKVEGAPFSLYCAQNKEALYWNPAVYCKESEFATVQAYYADPENYIYYIGNYLEDEDHIRLDEADEGYAEEAVRFIIRLEDALGKSALLNPLRPFEESKTEIVTQLLEWNRVTLYRVSKDGFFTTLHKELAILDDTLYVFVSYDGDTGTATFYRFDEAVSSRLVPLFKKHGFSSQ